MDSVEVKPRIAGEINRVAFTEGENVTRGQLLFSIDREALERQALEEQANLERDAAMEQQARAVVARVYWRAGGARSWLATSES